jgi:hypothetical protein
MLESFVRQLALEHGQDRGPARRLELGALGRRYVGEGRFALDHPGDLRDQLVISSDHVDLATLGARAFATVSISQTTALQASRLCTTAGG